MEFKVYINDVDYTEFVPVPLSEQLALDESLDMGVLRLLYTDMKEPFKPFSAVKIVITQDENVRELYFFISSDEVAEIIEVEKYNHSLLLIEQSKWLERFTGIVKTNTGTIVKNYAEGKSYVPILTHLYGDNTEFYPCKLMPAGSSQYVERTSADLPVGYQYMSPDKFLNTTIPVISPADLYNYTWQSNVTNEDIFYGFEVYRNDELIFNTYAFESMPTTFTFDKTGEYRFDYITTEKDYVTNKNKVLSFFIFVVDENGLYDYTVTDVVNNLLSTAETIFENETPRFVLNEEQAVEYSKIKAPDFYLTGSLWECLSQIGSFIHAIPRLKNGVIYFDKLGLAKKTPIDLSNYCSSALKFDIEQYATQLDSTIGNIVNTDDKEIGSIIAPFNVGLKTVRTETGVAQLTDDNIFIETREPIEEIISVECGYLSDNRYVGDITPYIYESAEYATLSSYSQDYPNSKAFALRYTQGQKNITQLNFKVENAISQVFERYSILNIIARKLGVSASSLASEDIKNLQFKVKYVPVITARFKQAKSSLEDFTFMSMLDFNQSANKVNSFAYGENMKGTLAKLGNPEMTRMFIDNDLSHIPSVGQLYDEHYYISLVKVEYYKDFYRCEIALSKNFNKLSEYVGINSQKRFYEISEKEAVDRHIVLEDYCIIGTPYNTDGKYLINLYGREVFMKQFSRIDEQQIDAFIDIVEATGFDKDGASLGTVYLPVTTLAVGNSLIFNFHYDDNYSAGNMRIQEDKTKLQEQVRYTDSYGNVETLRLRFGTGKTQAYNYDTAISEGNLLPKSNINPIMNVVFETRLNARVLVKKDNRENIYFTYQLHFVTTDNSYILGSAFSKGNSLINTNLRECKIYGLTSQLNKFDNKVNLTDATFLTDNLFVDGVRIRLPETAGNYVAWAIVNKNDELVVGQNVNNNFRELLYFIFTHKIA